VYKSNGGVGGILISFPSNQPSETFIEERIQCELTGEVCPIRHYRMGRYFYDSSITFLILILVGEIFGGIIIDSFA
jgi:hypothetical protein